MGKYLQLAKMKVFASLLLVAAVCAKSHDKGWNLNEKDGTIMVTMKESLGDKMPDKMSAKTAKSWENSIKGLGSPEKLGVKSWAMLEKDGQQFLVGSKKTAEEMKSQPPSQKDHLLVFSAEKHGDNQLKLTPQCPPGGCAKRALEKKKNDDPEATPTPTSEPEQEATPEPTSEPEQEATPTPTSEPEQEATPESTPEPPKKKKSLERVPKKAAKAVSKKHKSLEITKKPMKAISKSHSLELKAKGVSKKAHVKSAIKSASKSRNLKAQGDDQKEDESLERVPKKAAKAVSKKHKTLEITKKPMKAI